MRIQTTPDFMLQGGFAINGSLIFKLHSLLHRLPDLLALLLIERGQIHSLSTRLGTLFIFILFINDFFLETLDRSLSSTKQPSEILTFGAELIFMVL